MSYQVGDLVGDYQVTGILGAGGMGKVYKVKNTISDREDAMKLLLPNLADDPELADRFIREIKVLASLNHPNIAGLRTAFRLDNQLLMVMELVQGKSLDERCKQGRIPVEEAISYISQGLAALGFAHKHGVIHRDIKPANMMLTDDGVVKLMDFGIAKSKSDKKLTQTGTTMGSLFYMSAEQVQGNELDGRSDLYSMGVSLYEMVTGARPFSGKSDFDIMIAQLQQAPQPPMNMMPELPRALNDIIMISLEKDPAKRFQTAEAFSAALQSITGAVNATPVQASAAAAYTPAPPSAPVLQAPTGTVISRTTTATVAPVAVGGAPSAGYVPTSNIPTVMAPQPEPYVAPLPPPDPSHGIPASGGSKGYRGLYMALGALIVVAVLAAAAIEVPRIMKARASGDQTTQVSNNSTAPGTPGTTAPDPNAQPQPGGQTPSGATSPTGNSTANSLPGGDNNAAGSPGGVGTAPSGSSSAAPGGTMTMSSSFNKPVKTHNNTTNQAAGSGFSAEPPVGGTQAGPAGGAGTTVAPPTPTGPTVSAAEIQELTDLHEKLSVRANTVNQGVENLRKEMAPNNLRGGVSAAQTRMRMNMDSFDKAMNAGDPAAARRYMNQAEHDVEFLEKTLNL